MDEPDADQELTDQLEDAIRCGDVGEVEALLARGAAATAVTDLLCWPMIEVAVNVGDLRIVQLLTAHGANIDVADSAGRSLLARAAAGGDHPTRVRLLLDAGADSNHADEDGWTPLHVAAAHGYHHVAAELLAAGAHRSAVTLRGQVPIDFARQNGHLGVMQLLDDLETSIDDL